MSKLLLFRSLDINTNIIISFKQPEVNALPSTISNEPLNFKRLKYRTLPRYPQEPNAFKADFKQLSIPDEPSEVTKINYVMELKKVGIIEPMNHSDYTPDHIKKAREVVEMAYELIYHMISKAVHASDFAFCEAALEELDMCISEKWNILYNRESAIIIANEAQDCSKKRERERRDVTSPKLAAQGEVGYRINELPRREDFGH